MKTVKSDHDRRLVMRHLRDTWIKPLDEDFPHSALISRATCSPWYADTQFMDVFLSRNLNGHAVMLKLTEATHV